jgi:hypothetical protein
MILRLWKAKVVGMLELGVLEVTHRCSTEVHA